MFTRDTRKFARLGQVIALLLERPFTKAELARRLGVSRATAGRWIGDLDGLEIPVSSDDEKRFWIDRESYEMPLLLNINECMAIHLAMRLLALCTDRHNPNAASAVRKIAYAIGKIAPLFEQNLLASAAILDEDWRNRDAGYSEVLLVLTSAWAQNLQVSLTYEKSVGSSRTYIFEPYLLEPYAAGKSAYVMGRIVKPEFGERTFNLSRIRHVEILTKKYILPTDFNVRVSMQQAWGIWYGKGKEVEVVLKFSPQVAQRVKETIWHFSQRCEDLDNGELLWRVTVAETLEMQNWVRGWGRDVMVLEPIELREKLAAEFRQLAQMYEN
ncbi:MAG TPA: WYL domain-containing transcriptional regulator [Anaerolineales bacterium]|nr:WYL domain-containing transcriptional regulator [Anaerolineales bacterium]